MAFMLGRQQLFLELDEDFEGSEDLTEIMSNVHLNANFLLLAREVGKEYYLCAACMVFGCG